MENDRDLSAAGLDAQATEQPEAGSPAGGGPLDAPSSPDMASFYAAAAAAGASQGSPGGTDGGDVPAEEEEGADPSGDLPDGPHGPLPELAEEDPADSGSAPLPPAPASDGTGSQPPAEADTDDDDGNEEEEEGAEDDVSMGILGHLGELRRRVMRMFIAVLLGWVALYGVGDILYDYLSSPLQACLPEGSKLIYTSPQGAFFTYLKVAFIASLFATCPYTFYQAWAFVAPGLYREEKRALLPLAFCSSLFFVGGAAFCFFLVFPLAFRFFMGFATDTIIPMISVEEYLSFALKLLIAFGLVFEMPLFSFFLSRFGLLTPAFMRRTRGYAILLIFIVAAILTPPDVISQMLMALPMMLLYEMSIYVSKVAYREKESKKQKEESHE